LRSDKIEENEICGIDTLISNQEQETVLSNTNDIKKLVAE
jgi:hypothetical protein